VRSAASVRSLSIRYRRKTGKYLLVSSIAQFDPCQTSETHERPEAKTPPGYRRVVRANGCTLREKNWKLSGNDTVNRRTRSRSLNDEAIATSATRGLLASRPWAACPPTRRRPSNVWLRRAFYLANPIDLHSEARR
jgi:hypothetical protein